jgi:hypothetical protein
MLLMSMKTTEQIPSPMRQKYQAIIELTDAFCATSLDVESAEVCRNLAAAMARKRPSPLVSGAEKVWACAIVYALVQVNYWFDKSQTPHTTIDQLCSWFEVNKNTASGKAKRIRDSMKMRMMDPKWCPPSKLGDTMMAWLIQVNGLIVDARYMPREAQEEAYRRGFIPYLP